MAGTLSQHPRGRSARASVNPVQRARHDGQPSMLYSTKVRALAKVAVPVVAGAFCVAARALASGAPPVMLDWHGPDDCQEGPRLLAGVERILAGERGASSLVAHVSLEPLGSRWHLTLVMEHAGRTTTRALDAESCTTATDAAAVVLALTIDTLGHDVEDAGSSPATGPDASSFLGDAASVASAVDAQPSSDETRDASADRSSLVPLVVFAEAASDTGTLPRTGVGFAGGLGFVAKPLRVEAVLAYWPGVSTDIAGGSSRGGSFTMFAAELRGCALAEASVFSLGGCAGLGFTEMRAQAFGVTTPISAGATWAALAADGVALAHVTRRFALRLSGGTAVPFSRSAFEIEGLGVVHKPAPVALELAAGVEAHF